MNAARLRPARRAGAGFTLVELMVALTGGLFVSIAVFVLAKHSTGFYQSEARAGNATFGAIIGFDRLRADIARAGFLSTPNVRRDPALCGDASSGVGWPERLRRLGSVWIEKVPAASVPDVLSRNGVVPEQITLAGSYASSDQFDTVSISLGGTADTVVLRENSPAMARLGYLTAANATQQLALLESVFQAGRVLRLVDRTGREQYSVIASVAAGPPPTITLQGAPPLQYRVGNSCGFHGIGVGELVNVVNLIRYSVRTVTGNADYAAVLGGGDAGAPFDGERSELVREEIRATDGAQIAGTEEVVSEFAVDLRFGLTYATTIGTSSLGMPDQSQLTVLAPGSDQIPTIAGDPASTGTPERIRSVRVRFSVRSREADRRGDVSADDVAGGLYRIRLDDDTSSPRYARVRTVQSDIALRNQLGVMW